MGILWTLLIGFLAGVIAKFLHPGPNEPSGFIVTTLLGVAGAFVATYLGQAIGWYQPGEGAGLIGAVVAGSAPLSSLWCGECSRVARSAELRSGAVTCRREEREKQMSRGYPSMTALLGLLAVAGYQNRDKIAEWLNAAQRKAGTLAQTSDASAASGLPANLSGILAGTSLSDLLSGGLRDLVNTFKQAGHGEAADSWVAPARINRWPF